MLFHASNNIVWRAKHISFTSQTILFRPRKSNLWKMECKNTGFHSPEGEWCQQIGRFRYAWCMYLPMSVGKGPVSVRFQNNAIPCESASMCILRIAREGPRNPRNCILVRGRGVWRASFDKVSVDGRPRRLIKTKTEARKHKRDGRTHPVHPGPVLPCLCMRGRSPPDVSGQLTGLIPAAP